MKNTKRIILLIIIFIGGTLAFAYWALYHFNLAFSDFDKLSENNLISINSSNNNRLATTSIFIATTTDSARQDANQETQEIGFNFVFPDHKTDVYTGCKYKISWTSSLNVNSINLSLVDAGTRETIGPIAGGIPKNISGEKIENFDWKVGAVWPGEYYILASSINGENLKEKSAILNIKEIPAGTDIEKICSE
jgi:hypothetical protein